MILMILKAKYRLPGRLLRRQFDPPEGTRCYTSGNHPSQNRTNSGHAKFASIAPRMKAYWGAVSR